MKKLFIIIVLLFALNSCMVEKYHHRNRQTKIMQEHMMCPKQSTIEMNWSFRPRGDVRRYFDKYF